MNVSRTALALALALSTLAACASRSTTAASAQHSADGTASKTPPPAEKQASAKTPSAFPVQEGWKVETPTSAMRKAQFTLPHAEKDAKDASLVVYYFGAQAGTFQANLDRWCGQFQQPDGRASADVLKQSTREVNGIPVHEVDLSGTYVAETAPGSGEHVHEEGWRMLAAVFEAKDGPYYAKLVGPAATVAKWEASFRKFVETARPGT
jgi:hypothetical protein